MKLRVMIQNKYIICNGGIPISQTSANTFFEQLDHINYTFQLKLFQIKGFFHVTF